MSSYLRDTFDALVSKKLNSTTSSGKSTSASTYFYFKDEHGLFVPFVVLITTVHLFYCLFFPIFLNFLFIPLCLHFLVIPLVFRYVEHASFNMRMQDAT